MVTLRCTQKLLKRIAGQASALACPESTTALGDWSCNLVQFGRAQVILCVSAASYLTVLVPAAAAVRFPERLSERLGGLLRRVGAPEPCIAAELAAMSERCVGPTASRVTTSVMNQIFGDLDFMWAAGLLPNLLDDAENTIGDSLYGGPRYTHPAPHAIELLTERWG